MPSIAILWKEKPSYMYIQARDQRVNQKRNNFHIKWSFFPPFFIVSSERIVAIQVEQFSFLWIPCSIYESHFATHLHAVNLCFKVLSFTLIMIIYSPFRKGPLLVKLSSTALPRGRLLQRLLSHGWKLRRGQSCRQLWGTGVLCNGEENWLKLGTLDSKPTLHPCCVILTIYAPLLSVCSLVERERDFHHKTMK